MGVNSMMNFNKKRTSLSKVLTKIVIAFIVVTIIASLGLMYIFPQGVINYLPYQLMEYMPSPIQNYYKSQLVALDSFDTQTKLITIKKGWSANTIAQHLAEQNIIKNSKAFLLYTQTLNQGSILKAGEYKLSPSMSAEEVVEILSDGKIFLDTIKVTIPEGFELGQIKEKLVLMGLADKDKLEEALNKEYDYWFLKDLDRDVNRLEGYLFPATYEFQRGASEEEIVDEMLSKFDDIFTEEYKTRAEEMGMTVNEVVTLSSIIEKEAMVDDERALISGVLHKRMDIDMMLQVDATIQYILGERKKIVTFKDLEMESPYNTYLNYGLPPGPIASPGEASIIAALFPEETDYLFYVAKKDGSHTFTKTYEEHLSAQRRNNN